MSTETSMSMIEPVNNTVVISSDCGIGLNRDEEIQTKRCSKCGRTLSVIEFNKSNSTKDGLQHQCRHCQREFMRVYNSRRKTKADKKLPTTNEKPKPIALAKVYAYPELAIFQPRQLMEDLKARGFRWEYMLEPQKKIYFDKI